MLIMGSEVDSDSRCMDFNGKIGKFRWRIQKFSSITDNKLFSEDFIVGGFKWRISIYPKGNNVEFLSIYLRVADAATLPTGWSIYPQFGFAVIDQINRKSSVIKVANRLFNAASPSSLGYASFLPLSELHNPIRGYLVNDACLVEVYVSTDATACISRKLIVETDFDQHKIKEADCVKSEPLETTVPSPTQLAGPCVATELEEPTEADMNSFFTTLESDISKSDIVFSEEEAREALTKLDEALNMTPVHFYDSGKLPPLKHAFKILANFECSSTTLTTDQKNELLAMEVRLKELADRAAMAVQDKNRLTANESIKLMTSLNRNLTRYMDLESDVKNLKRKLSSLMAEQKGIFRSSKEMKMELEVLGKEWPDYEARAKVAAEEEKTVTVEWGKMKDFISSMKGKI